MALTLETGDGLADADSLVSLAEVRAFASSRGKVVSSDDPTLEAQVRIAHDYLFANESKFQGQRRIEGQALPFPRCGMVLFGFAVPENAIPEQVKKAVCQLVIEGQSRDLLPTQDAKVVVSEAVGPISTTYAATGASTANPAMPRVDAFLGEILKTAGGGGLSVTRA